MAHIYPIYREVELRHPEYPEDAEPLIATVRRNLTNQQLQAIPGITSKDKTTVGELRASIAPYITEWNWEAEDKDGVLKPVPAPADGGPDTFRLVDDYFMYELYFCVKNPLYGKAPQAKTTEEDDRKNSSAASGNSGRNPHAATHATSTPRKPTPITDSVKTKPTGSRKRNTTSPINA